MLNTKQKEAVEYCGEKPLLIEAGPGSGKTRVLTERVKFLLKEQKVDPESLLVITFTIKAANEVKERLSLSIPEETINKMQISTIHSFCYNIIDNDGYLNIISDDYNEKANLFIRKYRDYLGFVREFKVPNHEINRVLEKFEEYSNFKVDSDGLIEYIKNTHPISKEYRDFVIKYINENKRFPTNQIKENDLYKESFYNAKYLAIAEAYPKYKTLLANTATIDFSLMQVKALDYLKKKPITKYKNILIDEFQDTDPIQIRIFKILSEYADSFTAVGDINQSIYGFRGAIQDNFDEFENVELISLDTNYRSTNEIVAICDDFISSKREMKANRNENITSYYIYNQSNTEEADNIYNLIKNLIENKKVNSLNDIAILFRTVKSQSNCLNPLIKLLKENNIPYHIKGLTDLMETKEIKAVMTMLYYILPKNNYPYIRNKWESEWLNLRMFTDDIFKLSNETKEILNDLQDSYEGKVIDSEKEVYLKNTGKKSRLKTFKGVFNRNEDILIEIFETIRNPFLEDIISKIHNEKDLEFFNKLKTINENLFSDYNEEKPTLLQIYYELLGMIGLLEEDYGENRYALDNLAIVSNSIYNYENIIGKSNIFGLFYFLGQVLDNYSAKINEEGEAIQIMTVHKSKGLEFPVVIVASLKEDAFPKKFDEVSEKKHVRGKATYYTPNNYLEYRNFTLDEEEHAHNNEEKRVIYVAMSRAKDVLVLSNLSKGKPKKLDTLNSKEKKAPVIINELIINNPGYLRQFDLNYIPDIKTSNEIEEEKVDLSYTSLKHYVYCPFKYKLLYYHQFKVSNTDEITIGLIIHKAFETINSKIKNNNNILISEDAMIKIIRQLFKDNLNITQNKNIEDEAISNILAYYRNYGNIEILDIEFPFKIENKDYNLTGAIDLIYKSKEGKYGIIDYKNTEISELNPDNYEKQLYTYLIALNNNKIYSNYEIEELKIYSVKSRQMISISINKKEIENRLNQINEVASNIIGEDFHKNHTSYCINCPFNDNCQNR